MDPWQGSSSRRSTTGAGRDNKHKEVMHEQSGVGEMAEVPSYCLFPEETGRNSGILRLHEFFSADRQQPKPLEVDSKAISTLQPCLHIQARRQLPTFFPGGIHSSSAQRMCAQDNNVKQTTENRVAIAAPASVFGGKNLGAPENVEEGHEEITPLTEDAMKIYEHLVGVHVSYFHACNVPYMTTSRSLPQQVVQEQNTQRAHDAQVSSYGDNLVEADTSTTVVQRQRVPSSGSSHIQHYGANGMNNTNPSIHQEQMVAPVTNPCSRLMHIKGQVAASCADANGSRFVQQAIEVATPREIVMVCEEIMPCVHTLAADVFGNHAIQKILEHGPQSCKRELISRLIGHVFPLSCDMYGCRVIQKALDVGEHNQKVVIAKELKNKVLKCARDKFACHVIQKCVECLPPKHIQFIFRSFCGKAKALSIHPYGSHVIQKVLARCNNAGVYQTLTAEIIEFANKLSADAYGNYVVQNLLEHGGQAQRSMIVWKFHRRVVSMCYDKFASNVLEKCLVFGSQEDRQLIIDEILGDAGGSQHFDHLVDMMINPYANFVIQKMVVTAEEEQVGLLLDVARNNADSLKRYPHGRHFMAAVEKFLSEKGRGLVAAGAGSGNFLLHGTNSTFF